MNGISILTIAVESLDRAHPLERKRLAGPDVNIGRELLVTLARRLGGWIGWEATNLRGIAESLAFLPLAERGISVADDVTIKAIVSQALTRVVESGKAGGSFAGLAQGLGFRRALLDTLLELRTAGIAADQLRDGAVRGSPAHELAAVLAEYERLLQFTKLADPAGVFRTASDSFTSEARFALDGVIALVVARPVRGLPSELTKQLIAHGAQVLDVDEVVPDRVLNKCVNADFFAAATPSDELREVLRRVTVEDLRWDDVEIVATDPDTYGIALDALSQRLGVGATMLQGIPLSRTRVGRALDRWLAWLDDGLPADVLREALEAGEINLPNAELPSTALARELRSMQIGWGRERFDGAVARLASGKRIAEMKPREDEPDEEFAARLSSRQASCKALEKLLAALLATTPVVPERGSDRPVRSSCTALAQSTLGFLALCPVYGEPEAQTMKRLCERLEALAKIDVEEVSFSNALAALHDGLADLRAWPLVTSDRKPWSAAGGMVHLTTVSHAGLTGRRRIFVVGFDADRTSGAVRQDPLLPDSVRRAVGRGRLLTSIEKREEAAQALAAALASLRGRVTFSYATSGTLDGREASPSPLVLQMWRQASDRAPGEDDSYEGLRRALFPPASAVPSQDGHGAPLDGRDVWLRALAYGPLLLDGTSVVREAFPVLAAGLDAHVAADGDAITAYHGRVPNAGPALDPTARPDREISPSSLETLAKCPLQWFYRYGLLLRPSQDPAYDEDRWLDPLQRGTLLHDVYETFTREYQGRQSELGSRDARVRMNAIVAAVVARWRDDVPPPAETVFDAEQAEIHRAAAAFLQMECDRNAAGDRGRWMRFELAFGRGAGKGPFALPDGRVLLTYGRVDRVDEMPNGSLRVIDYKTGKATIYARNPKGGPFNGGRQLQPALYLSAVQSLMGQTVSSVEYRFLTERGGNEIVAYTNQELLGVGGIVSGLLGHVHAGLFIPTNDAGDCGYCDYKEICRAGGEGYKTHSPRPEWAKAHAEELAEYASMLARRSPAGGAGT